MDERRLDPEFSERMEAFLQEVRSEPGQELPARTRSLAVLAALLGCQGLDEFRRALPEALLDMNPADCERLGVTDGDRVRLTSRFGTCDITVSTAGRTRPPAGMVFAPFFAEETLINLVVQDTYCPLSKEPDFKKTCVSIEKI